MKSKNVIYTVVALLLMLSLAIIKWRHEPQSSEAFDRNPTLLTLSKKALCRMACLQITKSEVEVIMQKGVIHLNESNKKSSPCPTFALQARIKSGQYIRVIFAQCIDRTTVLNCVNLEDSKECFCNEEKIK